MGTRLRASILLALLAGCSSEDAAAGWRGTTDGGEAQAGGGGGAAGAGGDAATDAHGEAASDAAAEAVADATQEPVPAPVIQELEVPARGISARKAYAEAYGNKNGGDWFRASDNETATLAWGESYVMMSLAAMFRATGDPAWLDRLAYHADGVLAQRDDRRGVTDYRGTSGACWRNLSYQPADEPYCYAVHSGMIASPMVEFALAVKASGLQEEPTYDGSTFGQKAELYVQEAEKTAAFHDDEWDDAGYYVFRADATFLAYAGKDQPLNQSNALGRLLLLLSDATGNPEYETKAQKLAQRFKSQLSTGAGGAYLWNYWGGTYASPGEDVSHAAINVEFAVMAADRNVVFGASDVEAFARTFVGNVAVDGSTFSDFVGGGSQNGDSYRAQVGRWLMLSRARTSIYAYVRDLYEASYPPSSVGSGSLLLVWGLLAEFEPIHRDAFFYSVDWGAADGNGWREATAYGANVLTTPPDVSKAAVVVLPVQVPRPTTVAQWDGAQYHEVVKWRATSGAAQRWVPYEPRWPFVYWNGGVLFQFEDGFVAGDGVRVREVDPFELPVITSQAPSGAVAGVAWSHTVSASNAGWFGLSEFPVGARIGAATGTLSWTPPHAGSFPFTVRAQNDYGEAVQSFVVVVN